MTKILPVDGITVDEIEAALRQTIYVCRRRSWCQFGGGYLTDWYSVATSPVKPGENGPAICDDPGDGPIQSALARAIKFNADREWSDPRVQRVMDAARNAPLGVVVAVMPG